MSKQLSFAFLGLSLRSSWGNGHATTYRALLRELARRGHTVTFFERSVPWYRDNADLPSPDFCNLVLYDSLPALARQAERLRRADVIVVGSFVPEGRGVLALALRNARGVTAFYDIDTPVTLSALARGDCDYLTSALVPELDLYLSFSGGPVLRVLEESLGARRAEPLYCSVDPTLYRPSQVEPSFDLGYLGTYSLDRQARLERLLLEAARARPSARFVVGGPQYPAELAWPANVERVEHVAPGQHRAFYAAQRWTLNLTRQDMILAGYSPSVRLFEAAACGTPIISDRFPGIEEFFTPGRDIMIAERTEQVLECLEGCSEEQRRSLADNARQRVLSAHTAEHRAQTLERYVTSILAGRRTTERVRKAAARLVT